MFDYINRKIDCYSNDKVDDRGHSVRILDSKYDRKGWLTVFTIIKKLPTTFAQL